MQEEQFQRPPVNYFLISIFKNLFFISMFECAVESAFKSYISKCRRFRMLKQIQFVNKTLFDEIVFFQPSKILFSSHKTSLQASVIR